MQIIETFWLWLIVFTDIEWALAIEYFLDNDRKAVHISFLCSRNKGAFWFVFFDQYLWRRPEHV